MLLAWITMARRDLPWRRYRTPYAVWVSEIMLQQTQAATVIPYFRRWLERFPDIATLASAPLQDVLKAWEGLGYYARARNLHAAAQQIMDEHGGELPDRRALLLKLPGIGRYTAGAVLSLAFGQAEPVLDGNVRRVLCRVYDIAEDPRQPAVEARLWELAEDLTQAATPARAGDLNEALMELGALVCTPVAPDCGACPLATHCLARASGVQADRPVRPAAVTSRHFDAVAAAIRDADGRYLIGQRPPGGLLGGLWEFPGTRDGLGPAGIRPPDDLAAGLAHVLEQKLGLQVAIQGAPFLRLRHAYTHFRITLHAFHGQAISGVPRPVGYTAIAWAGLSDLGQYALSVTDQKILAKLRTG
jgi:A/G-specific adenine glycosylase